MNVIAVDGGPRKDWSTATMLKSALEGAESVGAQTELVHLYDLDYKGCTSCFSCKRKGNSCDGLCAQRDGLRPVLERVLTCDVLLIASPIYFGDVTGETRSFIERLLFPSASYDEFGLSVYPGHTSCGLVLTMNCPEQFMTNAHYDVLIETHLQILGTLRARPRPWSPTRRGSSRTTRP
jgi:multimeric flavodoxin WrbA